MANPIIHWISITYKTTRSSLQSRADLVIENASLRQKIAVLENKHKKPTLSAATRVLVTLLRSTSSSWQKHLLLLRPNAVYQLRQKGYDLIFEWKSRIGKRPELLRINQEIRNWHKRFR